MYLTMAWPCFVVRSWGHCNDQIGAYLKYRPLNKHVMFASFLIFLTMLNLKSSLALARDHSTRLALHLSALLCDHFCSEFKLQYTRSKNLLLWGWHTSPRPSSCWRRRLWCLPPPMHGTCPYALWIDNSMTAHTWTAEGVSGCFFVPWKDSLLKKVVDTLKVLNCLVTRECDKCHCDTIYVQIVIRPLVHEKKELSY